ncbi:MAG: peptide chain release factor N(5)-glutamine methyltransferase [bacterium]|nr:peptide chain release factor N(5)-glutamine methyltransferase [bacterium]
MDIQKALLSAKKKIDQHNPSESQLDAEVLLSFVTKKPKTFLLTNLEKKLTPSQLNKFNRLIEKRKKGIPVAYLINKREFYGLDFYVNESVLIPRPETETLIEETIKKARFLNQSMEKNKSDTLVIADIGTGSGCIAIALAKYLPYARIIATDISEAVLKIAKKNARHHKVLKRISFKKGNLLKPISKKNEIDIIVANLPYLNKKELVNVAREPKTALYGGKMGLELIDELFIQLSDFEKIPILILEIAPHQFKAIDYFSERKLNKKMSPPVKDLAGRDRVAIVE